MHNYDIADKSQFPYLTSNNFSQKASGTSSCYPRKSVREKTENAINATFKECSPKEKKRNTLTLSASSQQAQKTNKQDEQPEALQRLIKENENKNKAIKNLKLQLKESNLKAANSAAELKKRVAEFEASKLQANNMSLKNVKSNEDLVSAEKEVSEETSLKAKWPTVKNMENILSEWKPVIERTKKLDNDILSLNNETDILQKKMSKSDVEDLKEQARNLKHKFEALKQVAKQTHSDSKGDTEAVEFIKILLQIKKTVEKKRIEVPIHRLRSISARSNIPVQILREQSQNYDIQFKKCVDQLDSSKIIFENTLKNFEESALHLNAILLGVRTNLQNDLQKETHIAKRLDRKITETKELINEKNVKLQNVRITPQPSFFDYYIFGTKGENAETEEEKIKKEEEYSKAESQLKSEIEELTSQLETFENEIKLPKTKMQTLEKKIKKFADVFTPYERNFRIVL